MANKESEWITIGGRKIELKPDEILEDKIREKLPSVRGEKESATKRTMKKSYFKRNNLYKSIMKIRDVVLFDKMQKEGIIAGFEGSQVKILFNKRIVYEFTNDVFLKSECIDDNAHWDTIPNTDRLVLCSKARLPDHYIMRNWNSLDANFRTLIKSVSPAGMDVGSPSSNNPIYNPINEDKTISQRIREEVEAQRKDENKGTD